MFRERLKMAALMLLFVGVIFRLLLLPVPLRAADHSNLEEGLPVQVEDAYPIAYLSREIQGLARYDRTDQGEDRVVLDPRLEFGFARNWQGKISVPFQTGSADRTGSGDIGLEAFYNFNTETLRLPAFALSGRADFPTGRNSRGVDSQLKFIVTQTLGKGTGLDRLHLNLIYRNNARPEENEARHRYAAILGYSRRAGPDTTLVADFVREQEREKKKHANIVEIGLRRQLTPLALLAIGVGAGIGEDSPKFRLMAAFQQSF